MTDFVQDTVTSFSRSIGNGATMGKVFRDAVDHVISTRDSTIVLRLIQLAERKGDRSASLLVRSTFGKIYQGAKFSTKAGNVVGIKIKDAELSNSAVNALHDLTDNKVSMRGQKWKAAFQTDKDSAKPEFDVAAWAVRAHNAHPEHLEAMIAALQARR